MTETRRWWTAFTAVLGNELRRWVRQPVAVASALLFPVAMASLVVLALGDELDGFTTRVAVVNREHGPASSAFVDQALGHRSLEGLVDVQTAATEGEARRLLDADDVDVTIVLPPDLSRRLADGRPADIRMRTTDPVSGDLAAMVVDQFVTRARSQAVAIARTGVPPAGPWPLEVALTAPEGRPLDAASHYGPGVGMFFVLVTLGFAAQRFVADRRRELIDRLAASPVPSSAVLAGRAAAALGVGGLSLAATAATMQLLFERSWGPALPVTVLIAVVVVALTGVTSALAGLCRTPEQAQVLAAVLAFVFALASGTFSPPGSIGTRPAFADLAPTTHALDGFALLATEHVGLGALVAPMASLLLFGAVGAVTTMLAARRFV